MSQIDLMRNYPKTNREEFINRSNSLNQQEIQIAKKFDKEYFDGPRKYGLGGYSYNPKFFKLVVSDIIAYYNLDNSSSILDVGCGKGFMMYDFQNALPNANIEGIDISEYCFRNAMPTMKQKIKIGSCDALPWQDNAFDLVISIATIHNLDKIGVKKSLDEIVRATKKNAFIKVNGYKNDEERRRLESWNIVANTILHVDEWLELFYITGYTYDYDFFVP